MKHPELVSILMVEDDPLDVEIFQRSLHSNRIANHLCHAIDGVEALEVLRGQHPSKEITRPYLILMDINMPRMDGIECLREIRSDDELKDSTVFIMTTSSSDEDIYEAYNLNVAGYMVKSDLGLHFIKTVEMLDRYCHAIVLPTE